MESMKKVSFPRCPSPRNPLKELNSISSSSSQSVEAPATRGCLSFFLPNSSSSKTPQRRPKSHHKTPKSAPNPPRLRPSSKPLSKQNHPQKPTPPPPPLKTDKIHRQRGKSCSSRAKATPLPNSKPSPFLNEKENNYTNTFFIKKMGSEQEPLVKKHESKQITRMMMVDHTGEPPDLSSNNLHNLACTPGKDANEERSVPTTTATTTPPVQASISPEIQLGASSSSIISTTPACFAAGHLLSRVTDKRKCRPRGFLTAGEDLGLSCRTGEASNNNADNDTLQCSRLSLVPAPTEASMHWLLSPCEEDQKGNPHCGSPESRTFLAQSASSPSAGLGFSSDNCGDSNCTSNATSASPRKKAFLISSSRFPPFEGHLAPTSSTSYVTPCKALMSKEERRWHRYEELATESFSCDSTLSSQNVIRTPQSDSSSERCVELSWLKNVEDYRDCRLKFDSLGEVRPGESSRTVNYHTAMGDPVDVLPLPGFSFQFSHSTTPSNASSHCQAHSTSSELAFGGTLSVGSGSLTPSQMRISWREGLVSRIFEMDDEFDCCQWLSEDEKDANLSDDDQFKCDFGCELAQNMESGMTFANDPMSLKSASEKPAAAIEQDKVVKHPMPTNSCAESISIEGGGLVASADSDWTLCYKNHLFQL